MRGLPPQLRGVKPPGMPYYLLGNSSSTFGLPSGTYSSSPATPSMCLRSFPTGYWPESEAPPDDEAWERSVEGVSRRSRSDAGPR